MAEAVSLPVECDASVCLVNCGGPGSCSAGVIAQATSYCGINCTGIDLVRRDGQAAHVLEVARRVDPLWTGDEYLPEIEAQLLR